MSLENRAGRYAVDGSVVLFVDDDERVLRLVQRCFDDTNYKCVFAGDASKAIAVLDSQNVDAIVSDIKMPEMDGTELLAHVSVRFPDVVRIAMSGTFDISDTIAAINQGRVSNYVLKPFNSATLKLIIYRELKKRSDALRVRERELERQRNASRRAKEAGQSLRNLRSFMDDLHKGLVSSILANNPIDADARNRYEFRRRLLMQLALTSRLDEQDRMALELSALFCALSNKAAVEVFEAYSSSEFVRRAIIVAKKRRPPILRLVEMVEGLIFGEKLPWSMALHRINANAVADGDISPELLLALNEIDPVTLEYRT